MTTQNVVIICMVQTFKTHLYAGKTARSFTPTSCQKKKKKKHMKTSRASQNFNSSSISTMQECILHVCASQCLAPLICQNTIRCKTQWWREQAASSSISLNKYQPNEWILSSHCRLYHKTNLCFISFQHLRTVFRRMRATCSNKISCTPHTLHLLPDPRFVSPPPPP